MKSEKIIMLKKQAHGFAQRKQTYFEGHKKRGLEIITYNYIAFNLLRF